MAIGNIGSTTGRVGQPREQVFTSSGVWPVPSGVDSVEVTVVGASGGVGPSNGATGGGGYLRRVVSVAGLTSVAVTVGSGGASGSDGGTSSFGSLAVAYGSRGATTSGYGGPSGAVCVPGQLALPAGTTWNLYNISGSLAVPAARVAYGNGTFVAVGHFSGAATQYSSTSPDGVNWAMQNGLPNAPWSDIIYAGGQFVAIAGGDVSSAFAATSPDGINWTQRTLPSSNYWSSITYGNGTYVITGGGAGTSSVVLYSTNGGVTWNIANLPSSTYWTCATYGNGTFVAVSNGSAVATSPDGITWTARTNSSSIGFSRVAYGNGTFLAIAGGTPWGNTLQLGGQYTRTTTSPDGITWTNRSLPTNESWNNVAYVGGIWIAVASAASSSTVNFAISNDAINWTQRVFDASNCWAGIAGGSGRIIVTGGAISGTYAYLSQSWDSANHPVPGFPGAGSTGGSYAAGGGAGGPAFATYTNTTTLSYAPGAGVEGFSVGGSNLNTGSGAKPPGAGAYGGASGTNGIVIVRWWQ